MAMSNTKATAMKNVITILGTEGKDDYHNEDMTDLEIVSSYKDSAAQSLCVYECIHTYKTPSIAGKQGGKNPRAHTDIYI